MVAMKAYSMGKIESYVAVQNFVYFCTSNLKSKIE